MIVVTTQPSVYVGWYGGGGGSSAAKMLTKLRIHRQTILGSTNPPDDSCIGSIFPVSSDAMCTVYSHAHWTSIEMSISEYTQIMKEAGIMTPVGGGLGKAGSTAGDNRIQVEHIFTFELSERCDKVCKGAILGLLNLGRHVVDSIRIVAIAGSAALILWGCSQVIVSIRKRPLFKSHDGIDL